MLSLGVGLSQIRVWWITRVSNPELGVGVGHKSVSVIDVGVYSFHVIVQLRV